MENFKKINIIGSGLFGSVCAYELNKFGYDIEVYEKRNHIGGNCYTKRENNITLHLYGGHIFHTKNENIWKYINKFTTFNNYIHKVYSFYNDRYISLPFNINTYQQLFNKLEPTDKQRDFLIENFIKSYSEKQWGRKFEDIPNDILNRLKFKNSFNNDYFENEYQGIPVNGYTEIFEKLLKNIKVIHKEFILSEINKDELYIYSGCIDKLFNYKFGKLEYRSLKFKTNYFPTLNNFQFNSVINYPQRDFPFTRILEHKHFEYNTCEGTYITYEYPCDSGEEYYPINDEKNNSLYDKYLNELKINFPNILVGGRLGEYKYLNMDETIYNSLKMVNCIHSNTKFETYIFY